MSRADESDTPLPNVDVPDTGMPGIGVPGIHLPDRRGRTGLDQAGRDLAGNSNVIVRDVTLLSSNWFVLRTTTLDFRHRDGHWSTEQRETYDRGNGATILLFNVERRTVLLTRQFRFPAYVNGHPDGYLVEAPAGLLDSDDALTAITRETAEETGFAITDARHLFDLFMSPGSVTEKLHFYAAEYSSDTQAGEGGGLHDEGEDIENIELDFDAALGQIGNGIVDAKTVLLLQWAAISGLFGAGPYSTGPYSAGPSSAGPSSTGPFGAAHTPLT
ncbi:NUDIX domain-containing protein [Subtercola frigoramans]|uniref:Nudix-type nucleoside diphosphatase (YffH/AdpP family) n=1 Tax=Subtercola frigoramans TaxID=120298 RepID=A0ABS2L4Z7_9MICO|nr:NUDIX domain-containing protein [Subtercola frigoramans]MBM7471526.1 nudix-type nucleoside diphosphatase (YffH/AdpP family) [Subtercola frigoramans]